MIEELENFRITTEIPVPWGDMDAMGHVNNTIYFRYFETARILYFGRLLIGKLMEEYNIGPILAFQNCYYKAAIRFPDKVTVGISTSEINDDNFTMKYAIYSHALKRVAAEGEGNMVFYDYKNKKRIPLPERLIKRINRIERKRSK